MHPAAPILILRVQAVDAFHRDSDHRLIANLPRQYFVIHAGDVEMCIPATNTDIVRRRGVAKSFLEPANLHPPMQRLDHIGGG